MREGQQMREASKAALRSARAKQVHPAMAAKGYTLETIRKSKESGLQWCGGYCKEFIDASLFNGNQMRSCRECVRLKAQNWRKNASKERLEMAAQRTKEWRKDNPGYERRRHFLRKYGVDPKWYEVQLSKQNGKCALCPATSGKQGEECLLFVDHDHTTGKPRGLLCSRCNVHLGMYEKFPLWHRMARRYLRIHRNKKGTTTAANFDAHRVSL